MMKIHFMNKIYFDIQNRNIPYYINMKNIEL